MTKEKYWIAINAADLAGFTFLSSVIYCLYLKDYPSGPKKLRP